MTPERLAKIENAIREVHDHGKGEVTIRFDEDDKVILTVYKDYKEPNIYKVQEVFVGVTEWGFGGVTIADGNILIVRERRQEKI